MDGLAEQPAWWFWNQDKQLFHVSFCAKSTPDNSQQSASPVPHPAFQAAAWPHPAFQAAAWPHLRLRSGGFTGLLMSAQCSSRDSRNWRSSGDSNARTAGELHRAKLPVVEACEWGLRLSPVADGLAELPASRLLCSSMNTCSCRAQHRCYRW